MTIQRRIRGAIELGLNEQVAVILTGLPRVGRTSLARGFIEGIGNAKFIDVGTEIGRADLVDPTLLAAAPGLFAFDNIDSRTIDRASELVRSTGGDKPHKFILLPRHSTVGNALRKNLIGLARPIEIGPIQPQEASPEQEASTLASSILSSGITPQASSANPWSQEEHWLRGGLPESLLAADMGKSFRWRKSYLEALVGQDHGEWGLSFEDFFPRVFDRIIRNHGQPFDQEGRASELRLRKGQIGDVVHVLTQLGLIRILENWTGGLAVLLIRDSGLLLAARDISDMSRLRANAVLYGHSWEGYATEALIGACDGAASAYCYRDQDDQEIDLILDFAGLGRRLAIEFKANQDDKVNAGFWRACRELDPTDRWLVHSGSLIDTSGDPQHLPLSAAVDLVSQIAKS